MNEHVSKSKKRFHIPNLDLSNVVDKSTTKDNDGEMHDETIEELTNTKKSRKVHFFIYYLKNTFFNVDSFIMFIMDNNLIKMGYINVLETEN